MNIVLIGFRGTGKTTVGKALALKLGLEFVDADEVINRRYGFTIDEIFKKRGESLFRSLESEVINELSKLDSRVLAVGGGGVLKYTNVKCLKRHGIIILLEADPKTIYQRIIKDEKTETDRPRLTKRPLYEEIKELLEFRKHYYHRAADYVIKTTAKTVDIVIDEVMHHLRGGGFIPA